MGNAKHLMMVSFDAVDNQDLEALLSMPNFGALRKRAALARDVDSVFVSNTYPVHSSIITGVYPNRHGLIDNVKTQPGRQKPDWNVYARDVHARTLYQKAAEAGLSVCSLMYPVTTGADIRWNLPEVPGPMSLLQRAGKMLGGGSAMFVLSGVLRNAHYFKHATLSCLDDATTAMAADVLREKKPDLLLLHLIDVDDCKHRFGPRSPEAKAALARLDARLGKLLGAQAESFAPEDSAVIVFSDHGCLDVHDVLEPNAVLKEFGLIREPAKEPRDFDAFFHCAGGSAFVKVYDPVKLPRVRAAVDALLKMPAVRRELTEEEMRVSGFAREFAFGVEAADGFSFGEAHKGQHGYGLRREGYHPFYMAAGGKIRENTTVYGGCVVDICPLAAGLMGLPLWEMEGKNRLFSQDSGEISAQADVGSNAS